MDTKIKYPVLKSVAKPFWNITDNIKTFALYSLSAAFVIMLLGLLFRQTFLCTFVGMEFQIPCANNNISYGIYFLIKLLIITAFLKTWYDVIYLKQKFNLAYLKSNIAGFFKFYGGTIIFLLLNLLPLLSLYLLIRRIPNPNWLIEVFYFTIVSTGFLVPLVLLRFYAVIADLIEGHGFKNFRVVVQNTAYQFSKILFSCGLILFVCLFLFVLITGYLRAHIGGNLYVYNVLAEFCISWVFVLMSTLMLNFIHTQKEVFDTKISAA